MNGLTLLLLNSEAGRLGKLGQYHGCWCPGSLRRQVISSYDIDYRNSYTIPVLRNDKNASIFSCFLRPLPPGVADIVSIACVLHMGRDYLINCLCLSVSELSKHWLTIEKYLHIWQVSSQLSWVDACQIWMRLRNRKHLPLRNWQTHDDVIKWKHFPRYGPFVRGIHRWPVTDGFTSKRLVVRSFDVFFDLRLNKQLSKQSRRRRFETPSRSLWRHCGAELW